jgi:hypothetical protein
MLTYSHIFSHLYACCMYVCKVICTPGRILDHLRNSHSVTLDDLDVLVLDEVDKLLDMVSEIFISFCILYVCLTSLSSVGFPRLAGVPRGGGGAGSTLPLVPTDDALLRYHDRQGGGPGQAFSQETHPSQDGRSGR